MEASTKVFPRYGKTFSLSAPVRDPWISIKQIFFYLDSPSFLVTVSYPKAKDGAGNFVSNYAIGLALPLLNDAPVPLRVSGQNYKTQIKRTIRAHHPMKLFIKHCIFVSISRFVAIPALLSLSLAVTPRIQAQPGNSSTRILVQPKNTIDEQQLQKVFASLGAKQEDIIHQINVRILSVPEGVRDHVIDALNHRPDIEFAEVDALVPHSFTPNDPQFSSQWHLAKMKCPTAWDSTRGSSGVIIAICDSGVDATHPDLAANIVSGWNFYDNNSDTSDIDGHGTGVAGTAAAVGNNGAGVSGVAMNCRIMPIRVSDATGYAYYSTMANAVTYAADHGVRVANLSFKASNSSSVRSAAQYLNSKGGVLTVSAGNDGLFDLTADNPYVLTVSATDSTDTLASWSSTGNNVDLAAPGVSVLLTMEGGGYGWGSGTSFSAPCVAGVAALVISANPGLSATGVMDILKQTADDLGAPGWDSSYGYGRVNAYEAVLAAGGNPAPDTTPPIVAITSPVSGTTVSGITSINVSASDNVGVTKVELYINGSLVSTSTSATLTFSWNTTLAINGSYTLLAKAYDAAGNSSSSARTVNVLNVSLDTTRPTVNIISPTSGSTLAATVNVTMSASDNLGVTKVELYLNGSLFASSSSANPSFAWDTTTVANGSYTFQAKAYDAAGNVGVSALVNVSVNNPVQTGDQTAPTVQILSPADGDAVDHQVKIDVSASDNVDVVQVDLYIDGAYDDSSASSSPTFTWNSNREDGGQHTLQALAYDAAGNIGFSPIITVFK